MATVVVTGWGAISPFGDASASVEALLGEVSAIGELSEETLKELDPSSDASALRVRRAGRVDFDPREVFAGRNYRPVDRTGQLAILAAQQALDSAGWSEEARQDTSVGLVLGTMFGSVHTISAFDRRGLEAGPKYVKPLDFANSVINAAAGQTAIWLGLHGSNSTVASGGAAGVLALAQASQLIRDGRAQALVAGGAEELSFEALVGFQQAGHLTEDAVVRPFDERRSGTLLGEGAALLMLEEEASAKARGARHFGRLTGHGNAFDTSRGRDIERSSGALERAIRQALADAGRQPEEVDAVVTSACGLPGDLAEGVALGAVFGQRPAVTCVASRLGCCLGAAGAFQALALVNAMRSGHLPGIAGLEDPDPLLPALDLCRSRRQIEMRCGLITSMSLDGVAAAVVLEPASSGA